MSLSCQLQCDHEVGSHHGAGGDCAVPSVPSQHGGLGELGPPLQTLCPISWLSGAWIHQTFLENCGIKAGDNSN